MIISKNLANSIVQEMKKIINKDLNFMQTDGKIIASTDSKRVGTFHIGAKEAILLNDTIIVDWDEQYSGAKKGINIPVRFYNEIIGVIGISGDKSEVEKYGEIIKRITEILIKEAYLIKKEERENESEKLFLEKILFNKNSDFLNSIVLDKKIKEFEKKKSIVVFLGKINNKELNIEKIKEIFQIFKKHIKKAGGYLMLNQNIVTCIVFNTNYEEIENLLFILEHEILKEKDISLQFGVGEIKKEVTDIKLSYTEALNSLEWCLKNKKDKVFYEKMDLEIILNNITKKTAEKYLEKIFYNLNSDEIEEYKKIFYFYEKFNGSLKKISDELFMHINTLQYKLQKIYTKTGFDIRKYEDFTKLKIAFMLI